MADYKASFNASKEWVVLFPSNIHPAKRAVDDLARCLGLLAGGGPLALMDALGPGPGAEVPVIALNSEGLGTEQSGFSWRAGAERVEIFGESGRGLCNGIYSFLAALGISWPEPGQEKIPAPGANGNRIFPLVCDSSDYKGTGPSSRKRFVPAGKRTVKHILKNSEAFAAWAARQCYDALILPLWAFGNAGPAIKELKNHMDEYGIALEAGGRDLSSLVPKKYFFLHSDFFRMEGGRRKMKYHFCPTSPGAIGIIGKEGAKLFRPAGEVKVFHLWPDKGAETVWCACPTCRAFLPPEQNRIGVNAAADVLAALNPGASVTFYEKPGEGGNIPLRKNLIRMEEIPEERELPH